MEEHTPFDTGETAVILFRLVTRDGELLEPHYLSESEATRLARRDDCAVIRSTYIYRDTDLYWAPSGSPVWPPESQ